MGIWQRADHVAVANGSATVTGTLTTWLVYVRPGDGASFDGGTKWYEVLSVDSNTQLTLAENFAETSITDGPIVIDNRSYRHQVASDILETMRQLVAGQTDVISTTGKPADSIGADRSLAFDDAAQVFYRKSAGAWDNGTPLGAVLNPASSGDFADRPDGSALDPLYVYLSEDGDGDTITDPVFFILKTASPEVWIGPIQVKGAKGDTGYNFESYGVSIYKSDGVATGTYYADRHASGDNLQDNLFAEIIDGDAGSSVDFYVYVAGAEVSGPHTVEQGTPLDVASLGVDVTEGDAVSFVVNSIAGAVRELFIKTYGVVS